jgi:hypothetical protein
MIFTAARVAILLNGFPDFLLLFLFIFIYSVRNDPNNVAIANLVVQKDTCSIIA